MSDQMAAVLIVCIGMICVTVIMVALIRRK